LKGAVRAEVWAEAEKGERFPVPDYLSHYLLFKIAPHAPLDDTVELSDQFVTSMPTKVLTPAYYAVAVSKVHGTERTDLAFMSSDILFYSISPDFDASSIPRTLITDQFTPAETQLDHFKPSYLGVPCEVMT
jgi:hypothetical protein